MKKLRKPISIILAVIMAISVCAVGFTVFAAPQDVEKQIEAAKELTEPLQAAFNELTAEERDSLSPESQAKIYKLAYDKEGNEKPKPEKDGMEKRVLELLPPTEAFQFIWELAKSLNGYKGLELTIDGKIYDSEAVAAAAKVAIGSNGADALKEDANQKAIASELIRLYSEMTDAQKYIFNCVYCTYLKYGETSGYAFIKNDTPANSNLKSTLQAAANINIANGVSDKDLFSETVKLVKLSSYKNFNLMGAVDVINNMISAYETYLKDNNETNYINAYNNYIDKQSKDPAVKLLTGIYLKVLYINGNIESLSNSVFKNAAQEINDKNTKNAFIEKVAAIKLEEPSVAFNDTVTAIRAEYNKLSSGVKKAFTEEDKEIYLNLISLGYYEGIAEDQHELFEAEKVDSEMSDLLKNVVYETLLPNIKGLLNDKIASAIVPGQDVMGAINTLFTNDTVTMITKMLMPFLHNTVVGLDPAIASYEWILTFKPNDIANNLKEEQFNTGIKNILSQYTTIESWEDVPDDLDWGVIDGDYETFSTALLSTFNGITTMTLVGNKIKDLLNDMFLDTGSPESNNYKAGNWNKLIVPLMEALGVDSSKIISSTYYTDSVIMNDRRIIDYIKPIIDIIYYEVLPKLLADPVDYLADVLPNLMYHLEDGCLLEGINSILDNNFVLKLGEAVNVNINIKTTILDLLKDYNGGIAPENLDLALLKNILDPMLASAGLNLDQFLKIGHLGEPQVVNTARKDVKSTVKVVADKTSVLNYLGNIINNLLGTIDLGNGMKLDFNVNKTFVKQEAPKYPHNGKMDKKVMNTMISGLDGLLSGFVNINELVNNGLCTQEMAANAITGIYGLLDSGNMDATVASILGALNLSIKPSDVAAALTEDIYKDLAADLTVDGDTWANVGLVIKNGDKVVDLTNMGFKDGDRDGFINTLAAGLRPLVKALADTGLITNSGSGDDTAYGLYETLIIPVFEALGITPAADSATFTANYNKLLNRQDAGVAYDYLVKTILSPVLGLIDDLAAAPAATLMKLLPNLAYAIQYNPTLAFVGNLLDGMGGLTGILNGLVQGIATGEDANGNPVYGLANFELPELPLDALASAGKVVEKKSMAALRETYNAVEADTADTFVTSFYYLYDAINYKDNLKTISGLLANIDGLDPAISGMIDTILNDVFTRGKEEALCMLGTILAADIWECPDGDGTDGSKTPSTGDYSISAAAFLLLMVSAGGAILLLKKKKPIAVK